MDVFEAAADPVRRDLLRRLARGPARVVDLTAEQRISRPAVSRHLRVLGEAGLVEAEDRGRERHYRLVRTGLEPLTAWLAELAPRPRFADHDLDGLDLEVRRTTTERRRERRTTSRSTTRPDEETA